MDKSLEEVYALAEAARLRQVVDRLRDLAAATTAELEATRDRADLHRATPKDGSSGD